MRRIEKIGLVFVAVALMVFVRRIMAISDIALGPVEFVAICLFSLGLALVLVRSYKGEEGNDG